METPSVPTSTIPQSSTSPQGADFNPAQVLEQILGSNKENLQALAVKAATPVAGGHMGQVPSSMLQPQQQLSPMHMDNREVVGAHNAKMQGIGNAVRGVTHMLATVETGRQNKQKVEVASATQQLLVAQAGLDQAQQVLKQDPNNADAKAAVERNKASMNGILSNDKLRKQIAKGFNIDFTDPSANKTLEHQGVAQGQQMAQQHLDYAEQFQQKTPTQMGPNVQAQAQYQAALAQRKEQLETVKAMGPIFVAQLKVQGGLNEANIKAATDLRKAAIDTGAKLDEQLLKNKQADKDNAAAAALEHYRANTQISLEQLRQGNPIEVLKTFNEAQKNYGTAITENQKSRQALNAELDKGPSSSRQAEIRRQLQSIDATDEQAKNAFLLNRNVIAKGLGLKVDDSRLQVPTVHVGDGAGNGTAAGTGNATTNASTGSSTDLDPRTGHPWKSSVSTADRLLVKGHYGAGIVSHDVGQTVDTINKGIRKIERFFDPNKSTSD